MLVDQVWVIHVSSLPANVDCAGVITQIPIFQNWIDHKAGCECRCIRFVKGLKFPVACPTYMHHGECCIWLNAFC